MFKYFISLLAAGFLGASFGVTSTAFAAQDAALITSLQGTVAQNGTTAQPFVKVRLGDVITTSRDGRIEVTYLVSGRQEVWGANSSFKIGDDKSDAIKGEPQRINKISPLLAEQLKVSNLGGSNASRVGMVRLRSINVIRINEIENNYQSYRKDQPSGTYVAELYKLNALNQLREFSYMEKFIEELRNANPGDPTVAALAANYLQDIASSKAQMRGKEDGR